MNGWKLVPVEPTEEMLIANGQCDFPSGQEWLKEDALRTYQAMLAAAPVPPAGQLEVLGYKFQFAGWIGTDGPQGWRLEFDTEKPAQFLFDDGRVKDFSELVDRAHVTPLTAENARLLSGCADLSSQVRELEHKMDYWESQNEALQSELTKVRESMLDVISNLGEFCCGLDSQEQVDYITSQLDLLAHQSAPAANFIACKVDESCGQDSNGGSDDAK